jgi:preprotein translocase subunit SecG
MVALYYVAFAAGLITAIVFSALVLLTGKGDAMSGGGSVRTTFKGKANFDDIISRWTLILGITFMGLMIVVDVLVKYAKPTP